ncbi:MAG: type II secretion system F family protein [Candidatus Peregrinibacteria bacterium]|nr:type II secretion system F family protein [Candidatus Peregrinibacteria bacterium]
MKLEKMHWLGIAIGLILAIGSIIIFRGSNIMYFLLVISAITGLLPFMITLILGQSRQKEKEEKFLAFTRDLVEMVRAGTPISKSIENLKNRNYGPLGSHIEKLANQLSIGLTLTSALDNFAKDTKSKVISRAVGLISEAEKSGGQIEIILESVAKSVHQIDQLREERKAAVSNLVTQGYLIFLVFIIIMLVLEFKILPLVSDLQKGEGLNISVAKMDSGQFAMPLFIMLLVQSFFAGLVIGKIAEGSIKDGFKHSFILLALTLLITTGARVLFR